LPECCKRSGFFLALFALLLGEGRMVGEGYVLKYPIVHTKSTQMSDLFYKDGVLYRWVYAKHKIVNGVKIKPKKAKCFRFAVKVEN
jgi:hypothetical protein